MSVEDFDKTQYGNDNKGHQCEKCGHPKMAVIKSNRMAGDTFKAGFQRNIMEYCETVGEYRRKLKERGLIEIGYEDLPFNEDGAPVEYWSDEMLKYAYDLGLSTNEVDSLRKDEQAEYTGNVVKL